MLMWLSLPVCKSCRIDKLFYCLPMATAYLFAFIRPHDGSRTRYKYLFYYLVSLDFQQLLSMISRGMVMQCCTTTGREDFIFMQWWSKSFLLFGFKFIQLTFVENTAMIVTWYNHGDFFKSWIYSAGLIGHYSFFVAGIILLAVHHLFFRPKNNAAQFVENVSLNAVHHV